MLKEDLFIHMRCDKGVHACDDEYDTERIVDACSARRHLQREAAQNAVPDAAPVKTCMDADDEIEEDCGCQMCSMYVDGCESAQMNDGCRVERDEDPRHNDDDEEGEQAEPEGEEESVGVEAKLYEEGEAQHVGYIVGEYFLNGQKPTFIFQYFSV